MPSPQSSVDLFAAVGLVAAMWFLIQRLVPAIAERRSVELAAWSGAAARFWPRLWAALKSFVREYRAAKERPDTSYAEWVKTDPPKGSYREWADQREESIRERDRWLR